MTKFTDTTKDRQFDNFVITDGNKSCHNDNLCAINDDKVVKLMVFYFQWIHICITRPQWVSPCRNDFSSENIKKKYLQFLSFLCWYCIKLKSFLMEETDLPILPSWCPVDTWSQGISSHGIGPVIPEHSSFSTRRVDMDLEINGSQIPQWLVTGPHVCSQGSVSFVSLVWGMEGLRLTSYGWFSARLQYLQCISNGDTAVLH